MLSRLIATAGFVLWAGFVHAASTLGDDGLHKAAWMQDTFKDLREDHADAEAEGKRLAVIIEQRGCIYCTKMHEEVYTVPEIDALMNDNFYVVQINMFGSTEVTDFDGETLSESEMVQKWGLFYTPTLMFFPEGEIDEKPAPQVQAAYVPGALSKGMFYNMLTWVLERGYDSGENFQKYHARIFNEKGGLYADGE